MDSSNEEEFSQKLEILEEQLEIIGEGLSILAPLVTHDSECENCVINENLQSNWPLLSNAKQID